MSIKGTFEGRAALYARLRKVAPLAEGKLARAQLEGAQELASRIKPRVRVRSGELQRSILGDKLSNRPKDRTPVGLKGQTKDPNATGVFALWRWRFEEFGTVKQAAHPAFFPTFRAYRKRLRRKMATAVNKAIRKARKT